MIPSEHGSKYTPPETRRCDCSCRDFVTGEVVLDPAAPHIETVQGHPEPLFSSEYSYSTVASPTFLDAGAWEFMCVAPPGVVCGSDFPAEYASSLAYHPLPTYPLEVEPDHYEPNVRAHSVSGNLQSQPEREAWAPATPFHGFPMEAIEAAAHTPVVFAGLDRKLLKPPSSAWLTSRNRYPSKYDSWVRRRRI